jgi:myo-inositol catabolism protein IolC
MKEHYPKPLYLLPFDHRESYLSGLFKFKAPLTPEQQATVVDSKQLIYEGFLQAVAKGVPKAAAAILVDEEFGAAIQRDAHQRGFTTVLPVEHSGSDEFEFEYGDEFAAHIEKFDPTFAKILVRYNPDGDAALNQRQNQRIKRLSDYCSQTGRPFMFELLVPATEAQLAKVAKDENAYDTQLRPELVARSIGALQEAGIEPDVWKIEGLDSREDCEHVVQTAQRDGRTHVSCIVLGRGADEARVVNWLQTAAGVPGFIGFAVGRTSFWDAEVDYQAKKISRQDAAALIAKRYREWVDIFQKPKPA